MVTESQAGSRERAVERLQGYAATLKARAVALKPIADQANDRRRQAAIWLASHLKPLVRNPTFERIVTGLILVNAVTLGMETSPSITAHIGGLLTVLDHLILAVFVFELVARMIVFGTRFWRDPWSIFDFLVVAVTLMPASDNLSVLRALRIVRALRLVSAIPSMRRVVNGLLIAIPGMSSIVVLLLLIFYVFAVMATNMFAHTLPDRFGTIGASLLSLFQVMSLDGWTSEVARPVMAEHPYAWIFFVVFILITSFTVLNLFIGIIVDGMQQQHIEAKAQSDLVTASRFGKLKTQLSVSLPKGFGDKSAAPLPDLAGADVDAGALTTSGPSAFPLAGLRAAAEPAPPVSGSTPTSPPDPRLDRLLDEIAALRAEVRALRDEQ
ncbi:MAG: ion transporter [Hyphomicrobiaceae bacterium]